MNKIPNGHEIITMFEQFYPKSLAMEGDRVGLQLGSLSSKISNVLIALDVTEEVVKEAIAKECTLIIAHHPFIFHPLKNILTDTPQGRIIQACLQHNIAVYAAHTNLDIAPGGVNDLLAEALQLQHTEVLVPTYEDKLKKLVVFVPATHAESVRDALGNSGAGYIGNYSHCTFAGSGVGAFLPKDGTTPFIGTQGELTKVEEVRIETVFPASIERSVIQAMIKAHPYEEVAYDIYPLENEANSLGLGKIGNLVNEMTLEQFATYVKECLDVPAVRVIGNLQDSIRKVAVLGGDGNKYWKQAKFRGADVYITGDLYYHVAHDAMALGLNMIDPGHNVEKVMKKGVQKRLQHALLEKNFQVTVHSSTIHTDPFLFL
ncbi:Nif3-like dinuclear metal center hexameric protein [Ectobacillus polymachus]|uniref:Nif3-like dinuclear metal center hexameric protein n=1 Tax=Ectobacillus polymachus TaxID=1508806 RepID=UPI003A85EBBD